MSVDSGSISIKGRRAVVLGGGIGGLAAAGVLSRHFEEVTVVERDLYPDEPAARPHAPQGEHVHILLARGLLSLSKLVPDLPGWLDEMGLHEGDLTHHVRMAYRGRWLPKVWSGVPIRPCTRPVLEHLLKRDVSRRPNVKLLAGYKAEGLVGRERARAVRISRGENTEELEADLIVDAMGRASPSAKWLEAAGVGRVEEESVDGGVIYASCTFELPAGVDDDWSLIALLGEVPSEPRIGAMMRIGPQQMLCAAIQYGKPTPPRSAEDFVNFFSDLGVVEPYRMLRSSKPLTDVSVFGNTANRWRHFGRLPALIDRFVILGDAACNLNPRYGQGMTIASLGAERLEADLNAYWREQGRLDGFSRRFQSSLEEVLDLPWKMAVMEDRLWVSAFSGKAPSLAERLSGAATGRLLRAVFSNVDAYIAFMRVAHMLDSPLKMLQPRVLAALAKGGDGTAAPGPLVESSKRPAG